MNAVGQKRRCNRSLITVTLERRALPESGQQALTAALESAVTMPRGGPTLPASASTPAAYERAPAWLDHRATMARSPRQGSAVWGIGLRPASASDRRQYRFGPGRSRRYRVFRENFCGGMEAGSRMTLRRSGLRFRSAAEQDGAIRTLIRRSTRSPLGRGARGSKREGGVGRVGLRGVGEHSEGWNSISGSADDTVRSAAPYSQVDRVTAGPVCTGANLHWPWENQTSVSPTPSVADPGVTTDRIAVSRVMSPG
jgi:hypothetical protein